MRLLFGGIGVASVAAVWMFALITVPIVAVVMLVAGLAWDDRRRRRKATLPVPADAPFSKVP